MKLLNLTIKPKRDFLLNDSTCHLTGGIYQYFGPHEVLLALAGRLKFKGEIVFGRSFKYSELKRAINSGKFPLFYLTEANDDEKRSPLAILQSCVQLLCLDSEVVSKEFIRLKEFFSLPYVESFQNLSKGQRELYSLIIAISLNPSILIADQAFECISVDNIQKLLLLLNNNYDILVVFTAGMDFTKNSCAQVLEVFDGKLKVRTDSEQVSISPKEFKRNMKGINVERPKFRSFNLIFTILAVAMTTTTATSFAFLEQSRSCEARIINNIPHELLVKESETPIIDLDDYFEAPYVMMKLNNREIEVRYDRRIVKREIKNLHLADAETVVSSAFVDVIGNTEKARSWLNKHGLKLISTYLHDDPIIHLNSSTIDLFKRMYLDENGTLYESASSDYQYVDQNSVSITYDPSAYYLPLVGKYIDTSFLESYHMAGYYIPKNNDNAILLGELIDKDFYSSSYYFTYRYLCTNPSILTMFNPFLDYSSLDYEKENRNQAIFLAILIISIMTFPLFYVLLIVKQNSNAVKGFVRDYSLLQFKRVKLSFFLGFNAYLSTVLMSSVAIVLGIQVLEYNLLSLLLIIALLPVSVLFVSTLGSINPYRKKNR